MLIWMNSDGTCDFWDKHYIMPFLWSQTIFKPNFIQIVAAVLAWRGNIQTDRQSYFRIYNTSIDSNSTFDIPWRKNHLQFNTTYSNRSVIRTLPQDISLGCAHDRLLAARREDAPNFGLLVTSFSPRLHLRKQLISHTNFHPIFQSFNERFLGLKLFYVISSITNYLHTKFHRHRFWGFSVKREHKDTQTGRVPFTFIIL